MPRVRVRARRTFRAGPRRRLRALEVSRTGRAMIRMLRAMLRWVGWGIIHFCKSLFFSTSHDVFLCQHSTSTAAIIHHFNPIQFNSTQHPFPSHPIECFQSSHFHLSYPLPIPYIASTLVLPKISDPLTNHPPPPSPYLLGASGLKR